MKRPKMFLMGAMAAASLLLPGFVGAQGYENEISNLSEKMAQKIINAGKRSVAVVDFTDLKGNVTELGRFLAEEFSVALLESSQGFEVVDRTHLQTILKEHKLSGTGLIDPQTARKLGQFAGVDALVTGTVTRLGESFRLSAKVLDVETAKLITATSGNIPATPQLIEIEGTTISSSSSSSNTGGKAAPPADETQSVSSNGFMFSKPSCKRAGTTVTCNLLITSTGEDRWMRLYVSNSSGPTKSIDDLGNEYISKLSKVGERDSDYELDNTFPTDLPTKIWLRFDGVVSEASSLSIVLGCYDHNNKFFVKLLNLPLTN